MYFNVQKTLNCLCFLGDCSTVTDAHVQFIFTALFSNTISTCSHRHSGSVIIMKCLLARRDMLHFSH